MKITAEANTDIGTKKAVNQDAVLVKQANTVDYGRIVLGVVADGMGGLSCGEVASASFVKRMDDWFKRELPEILSNTGATEQLAGDEELRSYDVFNAIKNQWYQIATTMNDKIKAYGISHGIRLGTTCVCLFVMDKSYLVMNVGDSRAYSFGENRLDLITHDQSYVQQQIDLGRMTREEAEKSSEKSVLLQCVGASDVVIPDFFQGSCKSIDNFLLCSDGFWRRLKETEIIEHAKEAGGLKLLTELDKERGEVDNISAIVISTEEE